MIDENLLQKLTNFRFILKSSIIFYIFVMKATASGCELLSASGVTGWPALLSHWSQVKHALTLTEMINQGGRMWRTPASCFAVWIPFLVITFALANLDQTVLQDIYLTTLYLLVYLAGETQLDLSSPLSFCFSILHCVSDQHSSSCTSRLAPFTNKQTNGYVVLVSGGVGLKWIGILGN